MAWDVHIQVAMPGDNQKVLAQLANEFLPTINDPDAKHFLQTLIDRDCSFHGGKGSLTLWGKVGNRVNAQTFVEELRPFWQGVYQAKDADGDEAVLLDFERIVVFYEPEQQGYAQCFEIFLEDDLSHFRTNWDIQIRQHDLPFSWGQA
jgi:hypothetical protein